MSTKMKPTYSGKIGRAACAFVLAVGMSWPCGMALAADDSGDATPAEEVPSDDGGQSGAQEPDPVVDAGDGAAEDPAPEPVAPEPVAPEPEESDPAAPDPADPEPATSDPAPAPSEPVDRDKEQILQAARNAQLKGIEALEKYLNGTLTPEDDEVVVTVDLEGLAAIDKDLANEFRPIQNAARERLAAAEEKDSSEKEGKKSSDKSGDSDNKKKDKDDDAHKSKYPEWTYKGDTSAPPTFHGPSLETAKFVAVIGESSRKLAAEHDLYASVMIAQAIVESESGTSTLALAPNYNLFAIEGNYHGDSVTVDGQDIAADAEPAKDVTYKKYPTYEASLEDYVDVLSRTNYKSAHKSKAKSYEDACEYLEGTYSDSKRYSEMLKDLISAYDLTRYDEPLGYELEGEYDADLSDLVLHAADNLGKPYVWGATGPNGYDCSGLVVSSYSSTLGVQLPRTTYYQCLQGEDVDFANLHSGDLLFFTNSANEADHVAMYVGEGCYIESTTPGGVQITALSEHMPTFAKRMLPTRES